MRKRITEVLQILEQSVGLSTGRITSSEMLLNSVSDYLIEGDSTQMQDQLLKALILTDAATATRVTSSLRLLLQRIEAQEVTDDSPSELVVTDLDQDTRGVSRGVGSPSGGAILPLITAAAFAAYLAHHRQRGQATFNGYSGGFGKRRIISLGRTGRSKKQKVSGEVQVKGSSADLSNLVPHIGKGKYQIEGKLRYVGYAEPSRRRRH